jgi:hypothetical protein
MLHNLSAGSGQLWFLEASMNSMSDFCVLGARNCTVQDSNNASPVVVLYMSQSI